MKLKHRNRITQYLAEPPPCRQYPVLPPPRPRSWASTLAMCAMIGVVGAIVVAGMVCFWEGAK